LFLLATFSLVLPRAINPEWAFQGLERMGIMSLSKIVEQLIYISLILVFIHNLNDLLAVPLFQLISSAAVALIFAFVLWKLFIPFGWRDLRLDSWGKYLIAAVPLGLSFVFIQVYYNLDVIMLGFMKSRETVGWYNAAYKLFFVLLGSIGVVAAAVFPVVIKKFEADKMAAKRFLEKYLRLMFLWTWPAVLLGWLWAEPAIRLIYGSSYLPGVLALKILLLNILVIAASAVYGTLVLLPTERNKAFMLSVGLGALCNLVLNLLLIPPFSLAGAAVATLITEIVVALMFVYWAKSEIELAWQPHVIKPGIASGLACGATLLIFNWLRLNDVAFLPASLVVFMGTYLLLIVLMGERKFLWEFVRELFISKIAD
jgi:O-antigen/teichoic acid export membrane protein